jgi:hypothetical protein
MLCTDVYVSNRTSIMIGLECRGAIAASLAAIAPDFFVDKIRIAMGSGLSRSAGKQ